MARSSSLTRVGDALSPALVVALLGAIAVRWLYEGSMEAALAAGLTTGSMVFCGRWLWQARGARRWRAARRWWHAERGGALVALLVFLAVAAAVRYLWQGTATQSVSWGLWIAVPLWLFWFTASLWRGPLLRLGTWLRVRVPRQRARPAALPKRAGRRPASRSPLQTLSPDEFEALCAQVGTWWGFQTRVVGQAGDGGVDVELWRDGEYVIAQCKHYFDRSVGPGHIRDFFGALIHSGASRGFFFTSGYFTRGAEEFAKGKPIALIDRTYIENALDRYQ